MSDGIVNRIAKSKLKTIDLSEYKPNIKIHSIDIKDFLYSSLILKEVFFRKKLDEFDFKFYRNCIIALHCSAETIIPMWSYMLITSRLELENGIVYFGDEQFVEETLFINEIKKIDGKKFKEQSVLVNGCSNVKIPESIYIEITKKLHPYVKNLMFGEACSFVPVFKRKK